MKLSDSELLMSVSDHRAGFYFGNLTLWRVLGVGS